MKESKDEMIMLMKIVGILCFALCVCQAVLGDNLRLPGGVKATVVSATTADLEFRVDWSNSWRTPMNHDAVYLFCKFSTVSGGRWHHVVLEPSVSSHGVGEGYGLEVVNGGRGVFVYRLSEGQGSSSTTLRLRWKLDGNTPYPVSGADVSGGKVRVSVHGLEMVSVPTGPFYAGDGVSPGGFTDPGFGILPSALDLIGTGGFAYTGNGGEAAYASRAADRYDQADYNASNRHDWAGTAFPVTWQVDFKAGKRIRYFGVSGLRSGDLPGAPAGTWYLEGSDDAKTWSELWSGGSEHWGLSGTSYPVQRAIRVAKPGTYRYYRLRIPDTQNAALANNVRIANVSMTESDLSGGLHSGGVLQDGFSSGLPSLCPTGVVGFYAMKYELTQEQYVTFLNQLPLSGQYTRTIGGLLDGLEEGDYVFGSSRTSASSRNGIVVVERHLETGAPYVFGCDLDRGDLPGRLGDGQSLACNYLSPLDLLAYADWSGLRPLGELEYEKMCRGTVEYRPGGADFAWGMAPAEFPSGVSSGGRPDESPAGGGNVNGGGVLGGPCRVGMFVGPGGRVSGGSTVLGFSDLSGNVGEVCCNVGVYGRQLDRRSHGGGELRENGTHTVAGWPTESSAYGVRGGDYTSPSSDLSVSNRKWSEGRFTDLSERQSTVGGRLGCTREPQAVASVLSLSNGLSSGGQTVFDTVCDGSDYVIRGNDPSEGRPCRYLWYRSGNGGETWEIMEGENCRDLKLTGGVAIDGQMLRQCLYKRAVYLKDGMATSGVVGIVFGSGYWFNRLRDTVQPCMYMESIEVKTLLPATFEWRNIDNGKVLASVDKETSSAYLPRLSDMVENGKLTSKGYNLNVTMNIGKRCRVTQHVEIVVVPYTSNPFPSQVEKIAYANKDEYQIECGWTGKDDMEWKLIGNKEGISVNAATGVLSGLSQNLCYEMSVELVCKDYPDKVYRKKLEELERVYTYMGNYQTLSLLPGTYQMECWGADGGKGYGGVNPEGLGGYTKGDISFPDRQTLYLYVGEYGKGILTSKAFNGGGASPGVSGGHDGGRGGGATDIRVVGGAWNNAASLLGRIMVAGAGGGAMPTCGGTSVTPGHAGGLVGSTSKNLAGSYVNNTSFGGSQTAGGSFQLGSSPNNNGVNGAWGVGANSGTCAAGAGSGYYGGGSLYTSGGGGGSSFISGYPGCNAVNSAGQHTGQPVHYSGLQFSNMLMLEGGKNTGKPAGEGNGRIVINIKNY